MFISPETVIFAVRALIRVGTAARDAYEQHVRDADVLLASLDLPDITDDQALWIFFTGRGAALEQRVRTGDLAPLWSGTKPKDDASRTILLDEAAREIRSKPGKAPPADAKGKWAMLRMEEENGLLLLSQWSKSAEPPSPVTRIALAFADVALEYIAGNPGILGVGGNGEKLIGALAGNLDELLPGIDDKANWAGKKGTYYFAERALTIVLHAGLQTIGQNPGLVVSEERYRTLLGNVLKPVIAKFDENPDIRPSLEGFRDLLLGPMAEAALATLQADPRGFLGAHFDPDTAVGAVTIALLGVASSNTLPEVASQDGLIKLYRAALGVAVARPDLFITGGKPRDAAARDMLVTVGQALAGAPVPLNGAAAIDLGVAALDAVSANIPRLLALDPNKPWELLAGNLLKDVLDGFTTGLAAGGDAQGLATLFTPDEAFRLITIFMQQAAKTPGMVSGSGSSAEVKGLVSVFATAVAGKGAKLLTAADWEAVASAVAIEAARNPARLFKLGTSPQDQLLAQVLGIVLTHAGDAFDPARGGGTLLFGDTLSQTLQIAVKAAAGNATRAESHLDDLGRLIDDLDLLMKDQPNVIGAEAWLHLFQSNVIPVLDSGYPPHPTAADRMKLLEGLQ